MSPALIIAHLDGISRRRALTLGESLTLERAIKDEGRGAPKARCRRSRLGRTDRWRPDEVSAACSLREQGLSYSGIAQHVGRTASAIAAHLRALRLRENAGGSPL